MHQRRTASPNFYENASCARPNENTCCISRHRGVHKWLSKVSHERGATDRSGKKREAAPTASDYAVNLINPARRSVVAHVTTLVHTNCAHPTARRQFSLSYSYILI